MKKLNQEDSNKNLRIFSIDDLLILRNFPFEDSPAIPSKHCGLFLSSSINFGNVPNCFMIAIAVTELMPGI